MTPFEIERFSFTREAVAAWAGLDRRHTNWPVVYVLDNVRKGSMSTLSDVYVGESLNAAARFKQHLDSGEKKVLRTARVIMDDRFNKSVCLDLESFLIKMLAGDGSFRVMNRNDGVVEADYFDRERYRETFERVFDELKSEGIFTRSIPEIENSALFKLSPFKALTQDQAIAIENILEGLFDDLDRGRSSTTVIQGDPGTGKTIVAIYMIKLLVDIARTTSSEDLDSDSLFSEFFTEGYREQLAGFRIGLVVPQQSLRESIRRVFKRTPALSASMVLTPFDVGASAEQFDLLIVDETHRLNQRANQSSGMQNKKFREINLSLFGVDDPAKTQLDWIRAKSSHQIYLLDSAQTVRPADLPGSAITSLVNSAKSSRRHYRLLSQMRVKAGDDYVGYIRRVLSPDPSEDVRPTQIERFDGYDLRLFDDVRLMRNEITKRDREVGLARMIAGYAWEWKSKNDKLAFDIEIDGLQMRWNSVQTDWIASAKSVDEVGSIHTVQGYDLNYAGVIIGPDLRFDPVTRSLYADLNSYFDKRVRRTTL